MLANTITLLLLALTASGALADWQPREFTAHYSVHFGALTIGESRRVSRALGNGEFVFESETRSRGLAAMFVKDVIVERSRWTVAGDRPRPLEYLYQRTGGTRERRVHLLFDWKTGSVANTDKSNPWRIAIEPDTQDQLLYQLAVMRNLEQGKRQFTYHIADDGKLKTHIIEVVGEETVTTPIGEFHTVKIRRINDKRGTTLWCAEALDYLPVRIEYTETDGRHFRAAIKSLERR